MARRPKRPVLGVDYVWLLTPWWWNQIRDGVRSNYQPVWVGVRTRRNSQTQYITGVWFDRTAAHLAMVHGVSNRPYYLLKITPKRIAT